MYSGYIVLAYLWADMARVAFAKKDAGSDDPYYESKIETAKFYFARILPRTLSHKVMVEAGVDTLLSLDEEKFIV